MFNFILDFFLKPKAPEYFPGLLDKPEDKILGGVSFDEVARATEPPKWKLLTDEDFKTPYPVYDQKKSSACVSYAVTLFATIMYHIRTGKVIKFSPALLYSKRFNKPAEGSYMGDIFTQGEKLGFILNELFPTDGISEQEANNLNPEKHLLDSADAFKLGKRIDVPVNFDTVISVLEKTKKPMVILLKFGSKEWTDVPEILTSPQYGHAVTLLPRYGVYQGKKGIVTGDSWGVFGRWKGYRFLTEEFFKRRVFWVSYCMTFKFDEGIGLKPSYTGSIGSLQDCLVYEGIFPSNISARGTLGPITIQAIKDFQKKYGIDQTGNVGPKTGDKLHLLYP